MQKFFSRFYRLSPPDRGLLTQAAFALTAVQIGLVLFPFSQIQKFVKFFERRGPHLKKDERRMPSLVQVRWAIRAAARNLPPKKTCLVQSLAAQILLGRHGYPNFFRIGVSKDEKGLLKAHAWVESGNCVITGPSPANGFTPLLSFARSS